MVGRGEQLIKFEIEYRDPETGYWRSLLLIIPEYKYGNRVVKRYCFSRKRTARVILNLKEACLNARRRAVYHAKAYRSPDRYQPKRNVRIKEHVSGRFIGPGYKEVRTIWEDGEFLDC
jgi:hypothetical protein